MNQTPDNATALGQFREFLERKPAGKPFFLQLCSSDPHRPLTTPGLVKHDPSKLKLPAHHPDTSGVREDFACYYNEIAHFDVFFGEVMAELEQRGLAGTRWSYSWGITAPPSSATKAHSMNSD